MMKRLATLCLGLGLVGTMACVNGEIEDEPGDIEEAGLNLVVDYDGKSDVKGMRYNIKRVPCVKKGEDFDPYWVVKKKDKYLKDLTLPGGISTFNNKPFSEDSSHRFADYFTLLKPGCYDVSVQPMKKLAKYDKSGEVSKDCPYKVSKEGVKVVRGKTTEVLLVSQCKGKGKGALDIIAALNYPPKIVKFEYKPNKFVGCPDGGSVATVKICAAAKDKDGDPMNFYWDQKAGPEVAEGQPLVLYSEQLGNKKVECVEYTLPAITDGIDGYVFKLSVYDKFYDKYGNKVHAEDWINDKYYDGEPVVKSRDSLKFPIHVICEPDPDEPPPVGDTCPRTIGFWGTHYDAWPEGFDPDDILYGDISWGDVLPPDPENGACGILGRQYVAALLNQAVGAYVPKSIEEVLEDAEDILTDSELCPGLTSDVDPEGQEAVRLAAILDAFNNGIFEGDQCIDLEDLDNNSL